MNAESDLIARLKDPKQKNVAFRHLLDLYQERLYWHIRKLVITHEDANDALQNTFIKIFKGIGSFQEKSSLHTWMYRIAFNESMRLLEKNKRNVLFAVSEDNSYIKKLTQDEYFDGNELRMRLHQIISRLPEKQQRVFQMKYFDDLSFREIAEILDVNENTLKSSYYSAVRTIEEKIKATV